MSEHERDQRHSQIITLLRTLRDAGETLQRGDGGGKIKFESRALSMPAAYTHGSYADLEAALTTLRRMGPRHYWHVSERYIRSERLTHDFVNVGGTYFEAVRMADGRYRAGNPKARNVEVLHGVAEPRIPIARKPGARSVFVRAVIERWNDGVEARPLETALAALSFLMPATIHLPREVRAAA
jgi:hypothetical protein